MAETIAIGVQSMHQDMRNLDQIAMNLANVITPGYKRQITVSRPFADVVADLQHTNGTETATAGAMERIPAGSTEALPDMRAGALKATAAKLDLAIEGEGFFEVATNDGPAYTRQGSFRLDARGRLVNSQGFPVMGSNGEIALAHGAPTIDMAGNVFDADTADPTALAGQIKVVRFSDSRTMQPLGNGLFSASAGSSLVPADGQVRQGYLETSNVSTTAEMVQLMQTMRHFESVQKAVQGYDELVGTAIHKLGEL
jgi:flagellar basal-body rod protein FlgF